MPDFNQYEQQTVTGYLNDGNGWHAATLFLEPHKFHAVVTSWIPSKHSGLIDSINRIFSEDATFNPGNSRLLFISEKMSYLLLHCRIISTTTGFSPTIQKTIIFDYAIQEPISKESQIPDIDPQIVSVTSDLTFSIGRFDIPSGELSIHGIQMQNNTNEDASRSTLKTSDTLPQQSQIPFELSISRSKQTYPNSDPPKIETLLKTTATVRTHEPVSIETQLQLQRKLKELIELACNHQINTGSTSIGVITGLDTYTPSTKSHSTVQSVTEHTILRNNSVTDARHITPNEYLFSFNDIAAKGITEWFDLFNQFETGLSALNSVIIFPKSVPLETRVLSVGVALESIGGQILMGQNHYFHEYEDGHRSNSPWFSDQVKAIIDDPALHNFITDNENEYSQWVQGISDTYNGTKHIDHRRRTDFEMFQYEQEAIRLLRYWVAVHIGCPEEKIWYDITNRSPRYFKKDNTEIQAIPSIFKGLNKNQR